MHGGLPKIKGIEKQGECCKNIHYKINALHDDIGPLIVAHGSQEH